MLPKYRAWDEKHNEMIRVISINFDEKFIRGLTEVESNLDIESSYNFEDIELMQSTGLIDEHGIEIYEGDVVKVTDDRWGDDAIISDVVWFGDSEWRYPAFDLNGLYIPKDFHFEANTLNTCIVENKVEVIGNKFEHSHLLKNQYLLEE